MVSSVRCSVAPNSTEQYSNRHLLVALIARALACSWCPTCHTPAVLPLAWTKPASASCYAGLLPTPLLVLPHVLCACCALAAGPHASRPQLARQLLASRRTPARRTPACLLLARAATRSSVLVRCVAGHLRFSVVRLIRLGGSPKPKPNPTTGIAKK